MNMDRTRHGGIRLSDPLTASEPSPGVPEPIMEHSGRFLPSTRYRHPGDVIRLIGSGLVLAGMLAAVALAPNRLTGPGAAAVTWLGSDPAGRVLTGLVQVAFVIAAAAAVAAVCAAAGSACWPAWRLGPSRPTPRWQASCTWPVTSIRPRSPSWVSTARGWPARRFPGRPCSPRRWRSPWPQRRG